MKDTNADDFVVKKLTRLSQDLDGNQGRNV